MSRSPELNWIVCERTGKWAAALRREESVGEQNVREVRYPDELPTAVAATPGATMVVMELRVEGLAASLDGLAAAARFGLRVLPVAVADAELVDVELLAREAGAIHFLTSPRRIVELVPLGERHRFRVPAPTQTLRERVLAELPWSEAASSK